MPVTPYNRDTSSYTWDRFQENYEFGISARGLLSILGDYWTDYFADPDLTKTFLSGSVELLSQEYLRVLRMALSSSVIGVPYETPLNCELVTFDTAKANYVYDDGDELQYIECPLSEKEEKVGHLVSSLFEPLVALDQGVHYDIAEGKVYFYVDIFNDETILQGVYSTEVGGVSYVLFWATDILLRETSIYNRFGYQLYQREYDSKAYKFISEALQFFYTNNKSAAALEKIINTLYGIPYSRYRKDRVVAITGSGEAGDDYVITTELATYEIPFYCEILVEEGQQLQAYASLARWHRVYDYLNNPTWFSGVRIPREVLKDLRHSDFYLEYRENNPDEYIIYNGYHTYEGSKAHDGIQLGSAWPADVYAKPDGREYERYLYGLFDKVIKYNMICIHTPFTFESAEVAGNQAYQLYEIIKDGLPVYLYLMTDALLGTEFRESVEEPVDSVHLDAEVQDPIDTVLFGVQRTYGGSILYAGGSYHGSYIEEDFSLQIE